MESYGYLNFTHELSFCHFIPETHGQSEETLMLVILVIALRADRLDSGSSLFQAAMISMIFISSTKPAKAFGTRSD